MTNPAKLLSVLAACALLMTGCLGSDDLEVEYTGETAITAFTLGTLNRTLHTTAKSGADSVYTISFDASAYSFDIDQLARTVANPDSLPQGVDAAKVLATVSAKNTQYVFVERLDCDSLDYFSSTDTVDFRQPRKVVVMSNSGKNRRDYTVRVNVHRQAPDSLQWHRQQAAPFAGLTALRAASASGRVFAIGSRPGGAELWSCDAADGAWRQEPLTLSAQAAENMAADGAGSLYVYDAHTLFIYKDGAWTQHGIPAVARLVGATPARLYAVGEGGGLVSSADEGVTWQAEGLDDDKTWLPDTEVNFAWQPSATNADTRRLMLWGGCTAANGAVCAVWTKIEEPAGADNQAWMRVEQGTDARYAAPRADNVRSAVYDGEVVVLAGDGLCGSQYVGLEGFLATRDGGLTFKPCTKLALPDGFECPDKVFALAADAENHLWIICAQSGEVWKGRINRLGWTVRQSAVRE